MKFIIGKDRNQTEFFCLDQAISSDNEVRLIDLFASAINLADHGFDMKFLDNGRPAYHPSDLLKLFIYGYLNRIRSSRHLEKECLRNMEVMWLMKGLVPDHNTIANFRKDNPKAIRKVFSATVALAKNFELIGGKLLAGDSTKLRAQNVTEKQLIAENISKHQKQRNKYLTFKKELQETGDTQISTSDPDSRQLITRNNITEVAYNIQTTVDAKHNIPIDFKVTNQNDSKAMGAMVRRAKSIIGKSDFTLLYDKGCHPGTEFDYAYKQGVKVMVAVPEVASHAPDIAFDVANFVYDNKLDLYLCPAGQQLQTNGAWYFKKQGKTTNRMKHYKTPACKSCSLFERCTKNKAGRLIERTEHAELIEANKQRIELNKELYRKRQAIVEHPFGIIKRQWDFYYIMTKKSIKHASADVGLIFTAFNLRRIFNLIDKNMLKEYLGVLFGFLSLVSKHFKSLYVFVFYFDTIPNLKISVSIVPSNRLYLN